MASQRANELAAAAQVTSFTLIGLNSDEIIAAESQMLLV